jgi:hypothetical protein
MRTPDPSEAVRMSPSWTSFALKARKKLTNKTPKFSNRMARFRRRGARGGLGLETGAPELLGVHGSQQTGRRRAAQPGRPGIGDSTAATFDRNG